MSQKVFGAGVEPGGLQTMQEIKVLICYMLASVAGPLSAEAVRDILSGNGMANFFDIGTATEELKEREAVTETDSGDLQITDIGRHVAETLEKTVPFSLRERAVSSALQALARRRSEQDNCVTVTPDETGCTVTCTVGRNDPLMTVSLRVADEAQAALIKDRFLADPSLLYQCVIGVVTGHAEVSHRPEAVTVKL